MGESTRFSSPLAAAFCALLLGIASIAAANAETDLQATEPTAVLTGRAALLPLIAKHARANAIPEALADAVAHVESSYVTTAVGGVGEIGLMQLRPTTAAMLGFAGTHEELFQPDVNIRYGVLYLAQAWRMTKGDLCQTLMKYRAGHGETRMTQRSVEYCVRARPSGLDRFKACRCARTNGSSCRDAAVAGQIGKGDIQQQAVGEASAAAGGDRAARHARQPLHHALTG
jgi:soluble lytic murein transglycosylase-like protein